MALGARESCTRCRLRSTRNTYVGKFNKICPLGSAECRNPVLKWLKSQTVIRNWKGKHSNQGNTRKCRLAHTTVVPTIIAVRILFLLHLGQFSHPPSSRNDCPSARRFLSEYTTFIGIIVVHKLIRSFDKSIYHYVIELGRVVGGTIEGGVAVVCTPNRGFCFGFRPFRNRRVGIRFVCEG